MNTVMSEEQIFEAQGRTKCTAVAMAEHLVTAQKQDAHTRSELAKAVREKLIKQSVLFGSEMAWNEALQAVLKVLEQ